MDSSVIAAAHAARLVAIDPLLPPPPPLAEVGLRLTAAKGEAIAWYQETAPGMAARTWEPARRHNLEIRLAGDEQAATLGDLLDQWAGRISGAVTPGDLDAAAVVELPSRDTEAVSALVHRGFVPCSVIAARKAGRFGQAGDPDLLVRPAEPADLDVATELNMAVVRYDAPFGKVTPREDTEEALRNQLTFLLGQAAPSVWLAERAGRVVGLVHIQLPPTANWAKRYVAGHAPATAEDFAAWSGLPL
ncbi:MAG TPA: GNAT family N-acetyltransferase, partial [Actinokineospora sp.]|nr:GNAT family N-acetyltransferase [Actinokineospora sp.]